VSKDNLGVWGLKQGDGLLVDKTHKFHVDDSYKLVSVPSATPLIVKEVNKNYVTAITPAGNKVTVYDLDVKMGTVKVLNRSRSVQDA
jgi:hypothetical protein